MVRFVLAMGLCSIVAMPYAPARAQTTVETEVDDNQKSATDTVRDLADGKVTYDEVSADVQAAIDAVANARSADRTTRLAAIMAVLALLFKLMLSGIKLAGGLSIWGERQWSVIRISTLCLGIAVYFASSIVGGMPWWEAFFLALSGPGSMVVHEYTQLFGVKARK